MKTFNSFDDADDHEILPETPKWTIACFCGYCGPADGDDKYEFCPQCGRALRESEETPGWASKALAEILNNNSVLKEFLIG